MSTTTKKHIIEVFDFKTKKNLKYGLEPINIEKKGKVYARIHLVRKASRINSVCSINFKIKSHTFVF